jgi:erythrin-vacuolar iron transport family protein
MRRFETLSEQEILALAISLEDEDSRVYADYAVRLRPHHPESAAVLAAMARDEDTHRRRLLDCYHERFGEHVPLIRRQDVRGFVARRPPWLVRSLGPRAIRTQVLAAEIESRRSYERAAARSADPATHGLLGELGQAERSHEGRAEALGEGTRREPQDKDTEAHRRLFVLQVVQPGLEGLMDGSVSTLAPVFAAAVATQKSWDAFLVGRSGSAILNRSDN